MANDFTIADVLAWARTKPADETYNFMRASECAVAQFGRETAREYLICVPDIRDYSVPLWKAAIADGWTFGAFVKRLEALCPETVANPWTKRDAYGSVETLVRELAS